MPSGPQTDGGAARRRAWDALARLDPPGADLDGLTRWAADALWVALSPTGVSWVGFYHIAPGEREMVLGHRRDKPACSPIGLHGVCGRGWRERRAIVVRDVAALGEGYVACDPRDRSELVVPLFDPSGACWGVVDADSHQPDAFDEGDAGALAGFARRVGLSSADAGPVAVV